MPADITKAISGNPYREGGAFGARPFSSLPTSTELASVHYGNDFDVAGFADRVSRKWKIKGYYYTYDNPFNPDITTDTVIGTAGQDTSILYAADAYGGHVIDGLSFSYSGTVPTTGNIAVQVPSGTNIFSADVTGTGLQYINFPNSMRGSGNNSMYVVLKAGAVGDVGKLTVFGHRVE